MYKSYILHFTARHHSQLLSVDFATRILSDAELRRFWSVLYAMNWKFRGTMKLSARLSKIICCLEGARFGYVTSQRSALEFPYRSKTRWISVTTKVTYSKMMTM